MAPKSCPPLAVAGVVASLFVAASLSATLYATKTPSTSTTATTTSVASTASYNYETPCGYCGPDISVTLRVENMMVGSFFNHSLKLAGPRRELIHFLKEAADKKNEFKFEAKYYANLGFFITSVNSLTGSDQAFWRLADGNNVSLTLGVSSYKPMNDETIVFSYTKIIGGH